MNSESPQPQPSAPDQSADMQFTSTGTAGGGLETLRASEEQFRRVIEDAPIPVIMLAEDGQVLQISRMWTELTGYTLHELPTVDAWLNHAYGDGADAVRNHVHALFAGDRRTLDVGFDICTRAGELRHWSFSASAPGTLHDGRRFVIGMALDITERKRTEMALAEKARLLDLNNDAIIVRGVDNRILYWNHGATELYGWTREEAIGQDLHTLLQTEFEVPFEQLIARLRDHDRMEGEVVQVTRDGRRITAGCRWALDRDTQGRPGAILTTYNDITERKRRELNAAFFADISEDFSRLSSADEMMQTVGAKIGAYLNVATCNFLEVDESQVEALTVSYSWATSGLPSLVGRFRIEDYLDENLERASRAGEIIVVYNTQTDRRTAARAYTNYQIGAFVGVPFYHNGEWKYFLSVTDTQPREWREDEIDLFQKLANHIFPRLDRAHVEAALRESEERFRLLVASARDYAMILLDPDNHITFWSDGAERVFGWSEAEVLGHSGALIFTPEDRDSGEVERELRTALIVGSADDRRWHVKKDGARLFLDGVLIRINDDDGNRRGFVKIGRDATTQRRAEEAFQRARDELKRRVEERTAELVHLSTTRQELLQRLVTAQEDERRRIARELHDSLGQYLSALTLNLERVQMAEAVPPNIRANLARLQAVASEIDAELDRLTMELRPPVLDDFGLDDALVRYSQEWAVTNDIPVDVAAIGFDSVRLPIALEATAYRVVQEALTNVRKHAQARQVSVIAERRPDELRVVIEDDGVGFDPEAVRRERGGGRQLGLVGMSERATLAGGTITVESESGGGTSIYLHIPLSGERQERPGGDHA
jgi:PAS domain S-box-containing protein